VIVGRIWCDAETKVHLSPDHAMTGISFHLTDASGDTLKPPIKTKRKGWHTIQVTSNQPEETRFKLSVTYTAPRFL